MKIAIAAVFATLVAAPAYADQAPAYPTTAQVVQNIRKLTADICSIYPDVPCVLDKHDNNDDGDGDGD